MNSTSTPPSCSSMAASPMLRTGFPSSGSSRRAACGCSLRRTPCGLASDSEYIASVANQVEGPVLLGGHSYGGAVISVAGAAINNAVGLVYVAAWVLDEGESFGEIYQRFGPTPLRERTARARAGPPGPRLRRRARRRGPPGGAGPALRPRGARPAALAATAALALAFATPS
jgi:Alpha/beta hydrolase family